MQAAERTGVISMRGKPLTLQGQTPSVGQQAPAFTAANTDLSTFEFHPGDGKVWILASVPSLDTPTCATETRRFNQEATGLTDKVRVLTISMDLPFAQKRWCGAEGIQRVTTVSDYRNHDFAQKYGVMIKENGLLTRAVFVVGPDGKIVHQQIVPDISQEPDYAAALSAARQAAGA